MRKLLVRFFAVMGALLLLAFVVDQVWTSALARAFEQRVEELRAAGEPVDFESLAGPPVPDDQNAALALMEARRWYESKEGGGWDNESDDWGDERRIFEPDVVWHRITVDEWSDEDWNAVRAYVKECAPFFELVQLAVQRPYCRFDPETWEHDLPGVVVAQNMGIAFRARALVEAEEPGGSSKVARTAKILMSARKRQRASSVLVYLVGLAVEQNAVGIVREVAGRPRFDARAARAILDGRLRLLAERSGIARALRGERAWTLGSLGRWLDGGADPWMNVDWPTRRHAYKDALGYLDAIAEAIRTPATEDHEARDRRLEHGYPLTWFAPRIVVRLRQMQAQHRAVMNLARVALAVLEAKQETSVWPPDLDEIRDRFDDGLPLDPVTNAPFVYERTETGVRLAASPPDAAKRYPNPADMEAENLVWNLRDG